MLYKLAEEKWNEENPINPTEQWKGGKANKKGTVNLKHKDSIYKPNVEVIKHT